MPSSTRSAVRALEALDPAHVSVPALPASLAPVLAGAPRTVAPTPVPGRPLLRRHRGGTYSATVSEIRFEDGTGAHTDLIRLSPDVDAYSLDFMGAAPSGLATYTDAPWLGTATANATSRREDVSWILTHSYPFVGLAHLTDELRAAGHHTGPGTLKAPEAIAATQAALWHVANGVRLDTQRLDVPERGEARTGTHREALDPRADGALAWRGDLSRTRRATIELTMPEPVVPRGFTVRLARGTGTLRVSLEHSADARTWRPVPGAVAAHHPGPEHSAPTSDVVLRRNLGVGAAVAHAHRGAVAGYTHYRLVLKADGPVDVLAARLDLDEAARHRNDPRVVALYEYLLTGARHGGHGQAQADDVGLDAPASAQVSTGGGFLGPVRWRGPSVARVRVLGSAPAVLLSHAGHVVDRLVPDVGYLLHVGPSSALASVSATGSLTIQASHTESDAVLRVLRGTEAAGRGTALCPLVLAERSRHSGTVARRIRLQLDVD